MSLISAVTARGHMRFMSKEKGGVNADVFIEFLKRLMVGATHPIFLIVDRGSAHRAKKTKAFVETLSRKLRLVFLPPYSPDRNPDELVWKHLKADTVGHSAIHSYADFKGKVKSSTHSLQRNTKKIRSFLQNRSRYAAWIKSYNRASEHPSVYVIERKRSCGWDAIRGYFGFCRARSVMDRAANCCESSASEDPGTIRQRMDGLDLAGLRRQSGGSLM